MNSMNSNLFYRGIALLGLALIASHLNADAVLLSDNYGSGSIASPPYYISLGSGSCNEYSAPGGGSITNEGYYEVVDCSGGTMYAEEPYFNLNFPAGGLLSDTIPATVYVGDPDGYVSDEIITTATPEDGGIITAVTFTFAFSLDLTGSPFTCASVGGCNLTYNGAIQDVGEITWANGPEGVNALNQSSTTLEFQDNAPEPGTFPTTALGLALACILGICWRINGSRRFRERPLCHLPPSPLILASRLWYVSDERPWKGHPGMLSTVLQASSTAPREQTAVPDNTTGPFEPTDAKPYQ